MHSTDGHSYAIEEAMENYFTYPLAVAAAISQGHVKLDMTYNSAVVDQFRLEDIA